MNHDGGLRLKQTTSDYFNCCKIVRVNLSGEVDAKITISNVVLLLM